MANRTARRIIAAAAVILWVAAAVMTIIWPSAHYANTVDLIAVAAGCSTVVWGVAYFMVKGSAETVYELGYRAGVEAGRAETAAQWKDRDTGEAGDNVSFLFGV